MRQIIRNSITTPDGTKLVSRHTHDFVSHTDKNGQCYAVDGGKDYLRRKCDAQDYTETSVYIDDDFEVVREAFTWGTFGKNGDQPLQRKPLSTLDDDHIEAILKTQTHLSEAIKELFIKEQDYRNEKRLNT